MERLAVLELWSKNAQDSKIAVVSKQTREVATETDYIVYEISDDEEVAVKEESFIVKAAIVEDFPVQLSLKYAVVIEHKAAEVVTIHAADEYFVVATIEQQPLSFNIQHLKQS